MEPVFTVQHGHEPPPAVPPAPHYGPAQVEGQGQSWPIVGGGVARPVVILLVFLGVAVGFAFAVYGARHSGRDLAFVIVTYFLAVLLVCCLAKLRQLRRDPTATAAERRRVRIGVWCVTVSLGTTVTSRVADVVPGLALKLVVWGVSVVIHGVVLHFLFFRKDAERCDAEELGRRPATHGGLSSEEF